MATWIVHLRLAENLLSLIPDLDAGQFSLGNTAPDSGVPDENWKNFDPPTYITHLLSQEKVWLGPADVDFYKEYLAGVQAEDKERFSFRLGYFFHLLTDHLWYRLIDKPTRARFSAEYAVDPKIVSKVKKDWYGLDLAYVRDHPDFLFWHTYLLAEPTACDLDFLPLNAVNHQLNYIKNFYKNYETSLKDYSSPPYTYLTLEEVDAFVETAAQEIYRIYRELWVEKISLPDGKSMLTLLEK